MKEKRTARHKWTGVKEGKIYDRPFSESRALVKSWINRVDLSWDAA